MVHQKFDAPYFVLRSLSRNTAHSVRLGKLEMQDPPLFWKLNTPLKAKLQTTGKHIILHI
ncbi:hypothetical protein SAMN05518672_105234 [Chitinophaga sp. CF118]|nr:hypothetical protein SAMN05518672_105234 [Chitinophaga sp. CF118]